MSLKEQQEKAVEVRALAAKLSMEDISRMLARCTLQRIALFRALYGILRDLGDSPYIEDMLTAKAVNNDLKNFEATFSILLGLAEYRQIISLDAIQAFQLDIGISKDDSEETLVTIRACAEGLNLPIANADSTILSAKGAPAC